MVVLIICFLIIVLVVAGMDRRQRRHTGGRSQRGTGRDQDKTDLP